MNNSFSKKNPIVFLGIQLHQELDGFLNARIEKKRIVKGNMKSPWPEKQVNYAHGDLRLRAFGMKGVEHFSKRIKNPLRKKLSAPGENNTMQDRMVVEQSTKIWIRFMKPEQATMGTIEYYDETSGQFIELTTFDLKEDEDTPNFITLAGKHRGSV